MNTNDVPRTQLGIRVTETNFFQRLSIFMSTIGSLCLFNSFSLSIKIHFSIACFPFLSALGLQKCLPCVMPETCCQRADVFSVGPYAAHHMGTSIFHLGCPHYMTCVCLSAAWPTSSVTAFYFSAQKSLWFGLFCPQCIHLDSFPQEAWGPRVVVSETNTQNFL